MTTDRGRGARRPVVGLVVVLALVVAGCSGGDDGEGDDEDADRGRAPELPAVEVEPTAEFLARAADRSAAQPHRIEIHMRRGFHGDDVEVLRGDVVDGDASYSLDYGAVLEAVADVPRMPSSRIDVLIQGSTVYMQIPDLVLFTRTPGLAGFPPATDSTTGQLTSLIGRWCSVDVGQLDGASPTDVLTALTGQRMDPAAALRLVSHVEAPVSAGPHADAPPDERVEVEVRGERTTLLQTQVALADLMAVTWGDSPPPEAAAEVDVSLEVYVDDEGFIRKLSYALDMWTVAMARGDSSGNLAHLAEYEIGYSIEMYDYGNESIVIPDSVAAADITDPVSQLLSR
jgi:hypothetical protein